MFLADSFSLQAVGIQTVGTGIVGALGLFAVLAPMVLRVVKSLATGEFDSDDT